MVNRLFHFTILIVIFATPKLLAHPTSFKGSRGVMGYHSPIFTHNQLNYSFEHWLALGIHNFQRPNSKRDQRATVASINWLVKRWNTDKLQANLYLNLGFGQSGWQGADQAIGYSLIQFDIENRDYYFLAKHLQLFSDKVSDLRQSVVRAGLSPYVAAFDEIHAWMILEFQHNEFLQNETVDDLTPFLRLFYKNLLLEIGQSFNGWTRFNYIIHF